jgi:rubrerythrin
MKKMTEEFLKNALAGESQAHVKYAAFAEKAQQESLPNVARLFKANSHAEEIHAKSHFRTLGGIGKTADNLAAAVAGETFEVTEMYDAYLVVAGHQGETAATRTFNAALKAEEVHAALYKRAQEAVAAGKDLSAGAIQVCEVCGFTLEGDAPDACPICGAPRAKFTKF